jgi:hypothetical protein
MQLLLGRRQHTAMATSIGVTANPTFATWPRLVVWCLLPRKTSLQAGPLCSEVG